MPEENPGNIFGKLKRRVMAKLKKRFPEKWLNQLNCEGIRRDSFRVVFIQNSEQNKQEVLGKIISTFFECTALVI